MATKLKTTPEIDAAIRSKVAFAEKRGKTWDPRIPPILHPKLVERKYMRELSKVFTNLFNLVTDRVISALPGLMDDAAREREPVRYDAADDDLRLILNGILVEFGRELTQNEIKALAKNRGLEVSEFNKRQNNKVYKRVLDVDVFQDEPWLVNALETFANENAALITTLSERHINDVRTLVVNGMRQGVTAKELAGQIRNKINRRTRANYNLIARDQISKLNGQLTKLRQESLGIEDYTWRTSLDERVRGNPAGRYPNARPSHWAKEGKVYSWDDPPSDTGHPGEDFQCRCYAEPRLRSLIE